MPRRPTLGPATAALCAVLALTACQGSPEAGQPNTAPPPSSTPTPTPTSPVWSAEEQTAIDAAKARYAAARAAVDKASTKPTAIDRNALEKAGNGGTWIISALESLLTLRNDGWYQTGAVKITNTTVASVDLDLEQPEVRLKSCLDSSGLTLRFQKDGKAVPLGPGNGTRHAFASRLVYAPAQGGGTKMWWLIEEKGQGKC
jgi:hypothetical protein